MHVSKDGREVKLIVSADKITVDGKAVSTSEALDLLNSKYKQIEKETQDSTDSFQFESMLHHAAGQMSTINFLKRRLPQAPKVRAKFIPEEQPKKKGRPAGSKNKDSAESTKDQVGVVLQRKKVTHGGFVFPVVTGLKNKVS